MDEVTKEEVERILAKAEPYTELGEQLTKALRGTGFDPAETPPSPEPGMPKSISRARLEELNDLYDDLTSYYNYISDEITRLETYLRTTAKRTEVVQAAVYLECNGKKFSNAEMRKSYVIAHPAYQSVVKDELYFKQLHSAQEQRLRKLSKNLERVSREIWKRTQLAPHAEQATGVAANIRKFRTREGRPAPRMFRRAGEAASDKQR